MSELTFRITNLNCEACVKISTKALSKIPGVTDASVDLASGAVKINSASPIDTSLIVETLKAKDFETDL